MNLLIHEVAKRAGLHTDTIRRLERRGLIVSWRDVNGWRRYNPDVIERLKELYGNPEEPIQPGKPTTSQAT